MLCLQIFSEGCPFILFMVPFAVQNTFIFFFYKFIYLFILAVLGLHFCARAFSSCGKRGSLFIVVHGPLTITASPVVEHRFQTRRLSSCGSRAQLLPSMWDLPRPGLEPASPALAGRFSTTAPPGKPNTFIFERYFPRYRILCWPAFFLAFSNLKMSSYCLPVCIFILIGS